MSLRGQILDLLSDLQRQHGMAVLLITHDLNLVRRFADRVAVMERGHLVEQGAVGRCFCRTPPPIHPQAAGQPSAARRGRNPSRSRCGAGAGRPRI